MSECCHQLTALQQRVEDQESWIKTLEAGMEKQRSEFRWVLGGMGAVGLALFTVIMAQTTSIKADVTCIRADVQTIGARFADHLDQHEKKGP